ncbi:hypothetical protein [Methanobacterium congolense]|uniref:Uncharacterized protein n=1 Tax=Methanobacterium congolense TaxID=118062 RepID=A0A1D3L1P5_9EURY|nr:hypothetical protein [Methanobacterium congolense]SCG85527.1 putative protein [Methanobacterium congolense]
MNDLEKVNKLLFEEHYLINFIIPLKEVYKRDHPEDIDPFEEGYLIRFYNSEDHKVQFSTKDKKAVYKAYEFFSYQKQPLGTWINVYFIVSGGKVSNALYDVTKLIPSLNEISEWKFNLTDKYRIRAETKLKSTNRIEIEQSINNIQTFLNASGFIRDIGFHIQHYTVSPIPRYGLIGGSMDLWTQLSDPLTKDEKIKLNQLMGVKNKVRTALTGLNQSYTENLLPNRVARLWATIEHVFGTKAEPLLTECERKAIIKSAKRIDSLKKDGKLEKFISAISDRDRLSLEGRNRRIANNIADLMNMDKDKVYSDIQEISKFQGKHVHNIENNWKELEKSEKLLQNILLKYIELNLSIRRND